jgi:Glycosyltransferase family 92
MRCKQVTPWPHQAAQTQALSDCLQRHRHATRWLTFIDVDEFIDPEPTAPIDGEAPRQLESLLAIIEPQGSTTVRCTSHPSFCV